MFNEDRNLWVMEIKLQNLYDSHTGEKKISTGQV